MRTAERLMLRDGYSASSVDEVIRKAGLSKGSFYHFFDSKEALGLAALEHYYTDRAGRLAAGALVVTEAGGTVTGMDGSPFEPAAAHLAASNGRVHDAMLTVIADVRQRSLNRTN